MRQAGGGGGGGGCTPRDRSMSYDNEVFTYKKKGLRDKVIEAEDRSAREISNGWVEPLPDRLLSLSDSC